MKPCKQCGDVKPLDEFYLNSGMLDGRTNTCKRCEYKRQAAYRAKKTKTLSSISKYINNWPRVV